jgi:hypothetical protein
MNFERWLGACWQRHRTLSSRVSGDGHPAVAGTRGAKHSREERATRGKREPPSDAEIERGLRERAVTSARDAEVLLRWRQTVRPPDAPPGRGVGETATS